ncbi:MAG: hypothetical protein QOF61_1373 [Acidobacteriota bacterium]|nr:hypothetical protein [Acidobacteriota bacterium]
MADINKFIEELGDDISGNLAPRIEAEVVQIGDQIANTAAPKVQAFANQLAPKVHDFTNQLVKDIFAQQSNAIRDFVIKLIQDLVGRYDPSLVGDLRLTVAKDGIDLVSDDIKFVLKDRATGNPITSLDVPVHLRIAIDELFLKLDSATVTLENVQL